MFDQVIKSESLTVAFWSIYLRMQDQPNPMWSMFEEPQICYLNYQ